MASESWVNHDLRIKRHQLQSNHKAEYRVTHLLLDAADFGVAQTRQRVFIIATREDFPAYAFPEPTHSRDALLRLQASGEYWDRHSIKKPESLPRSRTRRFQSSKDGTRLPWVTVRDALLGLPDPATQESEALLNHWTIPGARIYAGHAGSVLDWPSKTIKAGVHGVPGGENVIVDDSGTARYYTLRETARLQSFPDDYFFEGARLHVTRQIGNAVPCALASAVAEPLLSLLSRGANRESEAGQVSKKGAKHDALTRKVGSRRRSYVPE